MEDIITNNEFDNQRFALVLDEDGRIIQVTYEQFSNDSMVLVDSIPDGDTHDYLYVDGQYVYDPIPVPETPPTEAERITELEEMMNALLGVKGNG